MGSILAVCLSRSKGEKKRPAQAGRLIAGRGLEGDAHAGPGHRQVSLLSQESIDRFRARGPLEVAPGDFAENIVTSGLDLAALAVGRRLRAGPEAVLEVTQIGKECHDRCAIYRMMGDCVMPREGVFVRVVRGGGLRPGDRVEEIPAGAESGPAFRFGPGEWLGAFGDMGTLVPLLLGLAVFNGLPVARSLVLVGLVYIGAALYFRIPMPVQPLKALAAIAIARGLGMNVVWAAGLWLGLILAALAWTGRVVWLSRFFTQPVIKGVQLGVGLMLLQTSVGLLTSGGHHFSMPAETGWSLPTGADFLQAFWLLVIPQLPLTLGNSVFAVSDAAREYFGTGARRAEPSRIALSLGLSNLAMGLLGGLPVCHGSGGLTAHYRFGARSSGATLIAGGACILVGCFGSRAFAALGLLPAWLLGGMLVYVGLCHVALAAKLTERRVTALAMGLAALASGNLAFALALGLAMENLPVRRRQAQAALS